MSSLLVRFYAGEVPDDQGRFLGDIQKWTPSQLEAVHNYIQWLFPLPEPSPVNPRAPVLDAQTIAEFARRPELRDALRRSLEVMIGFYGFQVAAGPPPAVFPAERWEQAARNWLSPGNHNHLRITRILRSTRLLNLPAYAEAFFAALEALYRTPRGHKGISEVSFRYWRQAAQS